jgi:hypothetical protein
MLPEDFRTLSTPLPPRRRLTPPLDAPQRFRRQPRHAFAAAAFSPGFALAFAAIFDFVSVFGCRGLDIAVSPPRQSIATLSD